MSGRDATLKSLDLTIEKVTTDPELYEGGMPHLPGRTIRNGEHEVMGLYIAGILQGLRLAKDMVQRETERVPEVSDGIVNASEGPDREDAREGNVNAATTLGEVRSMNDTQEEEEYDCLCDCPHGYPRRYQGVPELYPDHQCPEGCGLVHPCADPEWSWNIEAEMRAQEAGS